MKRSNKQSSRETTGQEPQQAVPATDPQQSQAEPRGRITGAEPPRETDSARGTLARTGPASAAPTGSAARPVASVTIAIPVAPIIGTNGYRAKPKRSLDMQQRLRREQGEALVHVMLGLEAAKAELRDGRHPRSVEDAIVWLLDQIAEQLPSALSL